MTLILFDLNSSHQQFAIRNLQVNLQLLRVYNSKHIRNREQ